MNPIAMPKPAVFITKKDKVSYTADEMQPKMLKN